MVSDRSARFELNLHFTVSFPDIAKLFVVQYRDEKRELLACESSLAMQGVPLHEMAAMRIFRGNGGRENCAISCAGRLTAATTLRPAPAPADWSPSPPVVLTT